MKKYIYSLVVISSLSFCSASDLSSYKNVRLIQELNVTQPAIVEITKLNQSDNYLVTNDKGESVPQRRRRKRIGSSTVDAPTAVAQNMVWAVDFQFDSDEQGRAINVG